MFSWICPQCGREVPPSYTECPDCKGKGLSGAAPPPQQGQPAYAQQGAPQAPPQGYPPPPGQPAYQPPSYPQGPPQWSYQQGQPQPGYPAAPPPSYAQAPPQAAYPQTPAPPNFPQEPPQSSYQAPPQPSYPPPAAPASPRSYTVPPPSSGLPTWLLTILFAVGFVVIVGGIYWLVGNHGNGQNASTPPTNVESPAAKPGAQANPLQKYVEISGVRFAEDARKNIVVKCTVTNHSDTEISGLAANVTIWGRTQKSEEDAVGTFSFSTDVGAQTSKEVSAPLSTKLKIYELPDWQNVTTDLQVTAPK